MLPNTESPPCMWNMGPGQIMSTEQCSCNSCQLILQLLRTSKLALWEVKKILTKLSTATDPQSPAHNLQPSLWFSPRTLTRFPPCPTAITPRLLILYTNNQLYSPRGTSRHLYLHSDILSQAHLCTYIRIFGIHTTRTAQRSLLLPSVWGFKGLIHSLITISEHARDSDEGIIYTTQF